MCVCVCVCVCATHITLYNTMGVSTAWNMNLEGKEVYDTRCIR